MALGPLRGDPSDWPDPGRQPPDAELFVRAAARNGVAVGDEPQHAATISRICRLCGGVPLARRAGRRVARARRRSTGSPTAWSATRGAGWPGMMPSPPSSIGSGTSWDHQSGRSSAPLRSSTGPFTPELARKVAGASPFLLRALRSAGHLGRLGGGPDPRGALPAPPGLPSAGEHASGTVRRRAGLRPLRHGHRRRAGRRATRRSMAPSGPSSSRPRRPPHQRARGVAADGGSSSLRRHGALPRGTVPLPRADGLARPGRRPPRRRRRSARLGWPRLHRAERSDPQPPRWAPGSHGR